MLRLDWALCEGASRAWAHQGGRGSTRWGTSQGWCMAGLLPRQGPLWCGSTDGRMAATLLMEIYFVYEIVVIVRSKD